MFKTNTEIITDNVTKIIVKSRYSPISGTTREVDGIISVMTRRKTKTMRIWMKFEKLNLACEGKKNRDTECDFLARV